MIRYIFLLPIALLAACGGGGGAAPALQSAALSGTVIELDGQTADRSGVAVTVLESGETAVSAVDGSFRFDRIPTGTVTLAFGAPQALLAQELDSGNESENEDREGNRIIRDVADGEEIEVRAALDNGKVIEFSRSDDTGVEAEVKAKAHGLEAELEVESETDGDKFKVEVEGLAAGTSVDLLLDDPADEAAPTLIETIVAGVDGKAKLEIKTANGDLLPGGATSVADLAGMNVIIELTDTGEELFRLEVPVLPEMPSSSESESESGGAGEQMRGKAHLVPIGVNVEGEVEIRTRPERDEQRFEMEAERLAAGDEVRFEIEDPDNAGSFLLLATVIANDEGEAEISTRDGLPMPLGVLDVGDLVGLDVRVVRSGVTILTGTVPDLVRD